MRIIYWSQTWNTEKIAELIKKGIELEGKSAKLVKVSDITVEYIKNEEIIIIGCPACGVETLDETEMEPFINSLQGEIDGKKVALFGSYGWGTGDFFFCILYCPKPLHLPHNYPRPWRCLKMGKEKSD